MQVIEPRSEGQRRLVELIKEKTIIFGVGHAGSGKTLMSLATGLNLLRDKKSPIKKIICMRPIVAERKIEMNLGALPGEVIDKITPYNSGLVHNLAHLVGDKEAQVLIDKGQVQFEAISLLRGSSFRDAFIIVDEAQLLDKASGAMKLILTRIGENSKVIVLGDVLQSNLEMKDLDMMDAIHRLRNLEEVGVQVLSEEEDIHRSPIVRKVLRAYGDLEAFQKAMRDLREK
jgi:phosphate starvation-inducible PhoH-like protein